MASAKRALTSRREYTGDRQLDAIQRSRDEIADTVNACPFVRGRLVSVRFTVAGGIKVVTHKLGTPAAFIVVRANYHAGKAGPTFAEGNAADQVGLDSNNQLAIACSAICTVDLWFYPRTSKAIDSATGQSA